MVAAFSGLSVVAGQESDDACAEPSGGLRGEPFDHGQAEFTQRLGDALAGPRLVEHQFRVAMEITPEFHSVGQEIGDGLAQRLSELVHGGMVEPPAALRPLRPQRASNAASPPCRTKSIPNSSVASRSSILSPIASDAK